MKELRKCSSCGGEPECSVAADLNGYVAHLVVCGQCGARNVCAYQSEEQAVAEWNEWNGALLAHKGAQGNQFKIAYTIARRHIQAAVDVLQAAGVADADSLVRPALNNLHEHEMKSKHDGTPIPADYVWWADGKLYPGIPDRRRRIERARERLREVEKILDDGGDVWVTRDGGIPRCGWKKAKSVAMAYHRIIDDVLPSVLCDGGESIPFTSITDWTTEERDVK